MIQYDLLVDHELALLPQLQLWHIKGHHNEHKSNLQDEVWVVWVDAAQVRKDGEAGVKDPPEHREKHSFYSVKVTK